MKKIFRLLILSLLFQSCSTDPQLTSEMLGGGTVFDPGLYEPEKFLVSRAKPNPDAQEAAAPVIIASHGYSATTFEWEEFHTFAEDRGVMVSRVLLGGHGRNYEDFKNSSWREWKDPIMAEYNALLEAGYTNIHLLGSSTSGALFLKLLSENFFSGKPAPVQILLVDPIVIPSNKSLSLIHILGPMLGYTEVDQTPEEDKVYYHYRPQETLRELQNLLNIVRKDLEKGIVLPQGSELKVYKSKQDPTADPVSAVLIYKGVRLFTGEPIDIEMINSNLHVYTRLELRPHTAADKTNQVSTFEDILLRVSN
jgi:carboxylesterase